MFMSSIGLDQWPQISSSDTEVTRAFNGSIFELQTKFHEIFPEEEFLDIRANKDDHLQYQELHKIGYTVNLLPYYFTKIENGKFQKLMPTL